MSDFTVIGLLGPAGSGKDLVADWFVSKGFVKISFADPMKRFVRSAFGISQEQLWGPSEKRNWMFDVTESWWYEAIGHLGDASEEIITKVLQEGDRVDGYLKLHEWFSALRKTYPTKISARVILQTLGTEWGRRAVDPIMWARYAHIIVSKLSQGGLVRYRQDRGMYHLDEGPDKVAAGVIIPDHRFKNEVAFTRDSGGYVIRLRRLSMETKAPDIGVVGHQSEAEQAELPDSLFDHVFNFEEGVEKVHEALEAAYYHKLWIDTRKS